MQKKTFVFIILSGIASFLNYATYPILAHLLSDQQFVSITVALALFTQISSFTLSIVALTIGLSKEKNSKGTVSTIEKLQAVLSHLFIFLTIVFLVSSPLFLRKLSLSPTVLGPIIIMLLLSIVTSVISGYLNGKGKLVKLGVSLVLTASLQLGLSIITSSITRSGTLTLYSMALGTTLSLILIYVLYRQDQLPRLTSAFNHGFDIYKIGHFKSLLRFVIASSISVLVINILLILDLLVITGRAEDAKLYADIYVISRVVYFGGMLFVWPFLANINIFKRSENIGLFLRLCVVFAAVTISSIIALQFLGERFTHVLFGAQYRAWDTFKELTYLAILYKLNFLIITSLVMYFTVVRDYWALKLAIATSLGLGIFVYFNSTTMGTTSFVRNLVLISFCALFYGIYGFIKTTKETA